MDKKILISIVTIDRDSYAIERVFESIKSYLKNENIDLLIVCRDSDLLCQEKWKMLYPQLKLITIPHYNILKRHNMQNICKKRNIALNYAKENNFDYLFFIDSDIIINPNTLEILLEGCEKYKADVCSIPYEVKWLGYIATGIKNNNSYNYIKVEIDNKHIEYHEGGGGMGCTLIKSTIFHILFEVKNIKINNRLITGEDIGFFLNLVERKFLSLYITNHKIEHL